MKGDTALPWALVLGKDGARIQAENQTTQTGMGWAWKTPLTGDPSIKNSVRYGLGLGRAVRDGGDSKELEVPVYLAYT